jgi:hypothetical protein
MRFTFPIIFLIALLCSVVAAQGPPPAVKEYSENAWKEFKSAQGRFSIALPGTPKEEVGTQDTKSGKLTMHHFDLETDLGHYLLTYVDVPVSLTTPEDTKAALDSSRDQALANGARLLLENDISLAGVVGRELLVEQNGLILKARYFFVKGRLYQIMLVLRPNTVFSSGKPSANPASYTELFQMVSKKFFDSFKVTE